MSKLFAIAIPVVKGKEDVFHKFMNELKTTRKDDFAASRKKLGVRERTFLQHTPMGEMVVVTLEGDNPEQAFARFAEDKSEFNDWFLKNVKEVHGVDLTQPPQGAMPELMIDSGELVRESALNM